MLPPLFARPPADPTEERRIRRLASARHAPASWLQRARIVTLSWDGAQVGQIAAQLGCHPRTVYRWLHRFNHDGIDGLGDLPRSGRVTLAAPSRNSAGYQQLLAAVEQANPTGEIAVVTDNLSSHSSFSTRTGWPSTRASGRCSSRSARAG
jgi:transposase-like protein